ncbi:MAG: hypothetical protein IT429_23385 [Gemmataceae bacterium]|nr:hypothetical protein [Gemmataceae bacterium]
MNQLLVPPRAPGAAAAYRARLSLPQRWDAPETDERTASGLIVGILLTIFTLGLIGYLVVHLSIF